ncbi:MAG: EAL domain-containing protein [Ruminiclostridium sp.]|nr:EAL domain-containing protein [Ruminiclostridium sp.]
MSIFDRDGRCSADWKLFTDSFPAIGAFKLYHNSNAAYVDKNAAYILQIPEGVMDKSDFFGLIDELNAGQLPDSKNIYKRVIDGITTYVNVKILYEQEYLLGFVQDVTRPFQEKNDQKPIDEKDELTGLYSRTGFIRQVRGALAEISGNAHCCMAVVHINGVEKIDHELNYDKTALCLKSVAEAMKKFSSEYVIVGVKSYKEFFVFFKQLAKSEISDLFKQMADAVGKCRIVDEFGNEIQTRNGSFSTTIGHCWYPDQAVTIDMMINYADFALFKAMSSGYTEREFSPEEFIAEQNSYSNSKLLTGLIDENKFDYKFQPIVSAIDGSVYGYEALMRPNKTTPLEVLRIARDNGKLYEIEMLTFRNVLSKVRQNMAQLAGKKIFINSVPDYMITEQDFIDLCEMYKDIMPQLVIELTEQSDLTTEVIAKQCRLFSSMGCTIAIDDYGSGYSNSAALVELAPDIIKIDRSLISNINQNVRKQHFLSGIVDFAKLNGIQILAEGIETKEEMAIVIRRGVDFVQGFYMARPDTEIITSIPSQISEAIRSININKPAIKHAKSYDVNSNSYEPIDLVALEKDNYTSINVNSSYVHFIGSMTEKLSLSIKVNSFLDTHIVFENVRLKTDIRPCVIISEKTKVTLEIKNKNSLDYDGIYVSDSSELVIIGDGDLAIDTSRNNGCCIGSSYDEPFGKITINMDMKSKLELTTNGDHAMCLGGGITSIEDAINLISGRVIINCTAKDCLAIGCYDGTCDINVTGVQLQVLSSGDNSVCVGSLCGIPNVNIKGSSIKLEALGINATCIGTISPINNTEDTPRLRAENALLALTTKGQHGACIGCVKQDSEIEIVNCKAKIYFEGNVIAGVGSPNADGTAEIIDSEIYVDSLAGHHSICMGIGKKGVKVTNSLINLQKVNSDNFILNAFDRPTRANQ